MGDFRSLYAGYFKSLRPNDANEVAVNCPFHSGGQEKHKSMSVNLESGKWRCFTCEEGGDAYEFYKRVNNVPFPIAKDAVDKIVNGGTPGGKPSSRKEKPEFISPKEVEELHQQLLRAPTLLKDLMQHRGLTQETIETFRVGYDRVSKRYTVPIFDEEGNCLNLRMYKMDAQRTAKMLNKTGYGAARLFPIEAVKRLEREVIICEGEMDCLLARQYGFNAVTGTTGAVTWKDEWTPLFRNKDAVIIYDCDRAGLDGSQRVAAHLFTFASSLKIVRLPLTEKGADITDYFVGHGHSAEDLRALIDEAPQYTPSEDKPIREDDTIYSIHLSQASNAAYTNKRICFDAIVSGKDLAPYIVPRVVEYDCVVADDISKCAGCRMDMAIDRDKATEVRHRSLELQEDNAALLEMVACPDNIRTAVLKRLGGINKTCHSIRVTIVNHQNLQEVFLIPDIDFSSKETEYVLQRAFYVGHGIVPNQSYRMRAITLPDPRTQYATQLVYEAKPSQDTVSSFRMDNGLCDELRIFNLTEREQVAAKLASINGEMAKYVTQIYGRADVQTAIDLAFHSVLSFTFNGQFVRRGWLEVLILGDTRTGKTETAQKLIQHYHLGEFVTGENASFAGLVGGMQQTQKRWSIVWGKVPLNDRRLVVIDEVSGLTLEAIGAMSGVRSSGVAEITKIQTERTQARTRLVWLSNPREAKTLNQFDYGIEAVQELIGKPEDIARFDFVVTCASNEVDPSVFINVLQEEVNGDGTYTTDRCQALILWAWSRDTDQVFFTPEATQMILQGANDMGRLYSSKIPLVEAADQRIKIARVAAAVAARLFSTDDGERLVILPEHVVFAIEYLNQLYAKTSLRYLDFSLENKEQEPTEAEMLEALAELEEHPEETAMFTKSKAVKIWAAMDRLGQERYEVTTTFRRWLTLGLIEETHHGYHKTPLFIMCLNEMRARISQNMR